MAFSSLYHTLNVITTKLVYYRLATLPPSPIMIDNCGLCCKAIILVFLILFLLIITFDYWSSYMQCCNDQCNVDVAVQQYFCMQLIQVHYKTCTCCFLNYVVMYYVHTGNCVTLTLNFTFLPRVLIVFFYCTWILYIHIYIYQQNFKLFLYNAQVVRYSTYFCT